MYLSAGLSFKYFLQKIQFCKVVDSSHDLLLRLILLLPPTSFQHKSFSRSYPTYPSPLHINQFHIQYLFLTPSHSIISSSPIFSSSLHTLIILISSSFLSIWWYATISYVLLTLTLWNVCSIFSCPVPISWTSFADYINVSARKMKAGEYKVIR